MLTDSTACD